MRERHGVKADQRTNERQFQETTFPNASSARTPRFFTNRPSQCERTVSNAFTIQWIFGRNNCEQIDPMDTIKLFTDIETVNDVEVTLRINLLEVIQEPPSAAYQHQQASPAGEVSLVTLQMAGQSVDPRRQNGNLNLRRASVIGAPLVFTDQSCLTLFSNHLVTATAPPCPARDASTRSKFLPPYLYYNSAYKMFRQLTTKPLSLSTRQ